MLISRHDWVAVGHTIVVRRGGCAARATNSIPGNRCEGVSLAPEKRTPNRFGRHGCIGLYTEEVA